MIKFLIGLLIGIFLFPTIHEIRDCILYNGNKALKFILEDPLDFLEGILHRAIHKTNL